MNLLEQLYGSFQMWLNTQSEMEILIFALVVIMITGTFGGLLAKRLKQPLLLGYILAGVFVGIAFKAGFGAAATVALDSLANIGVALLLFSMGLEFEKKDIIPIRNVAVWGTFSQVAFTLVASTGIAWCLNRYQPGLFDGWPSMMIFGAAFVSTSTAVVLKTLTARGQMNTLSSKVMIGMSIVQDLTVIPLFLLISKLGSVSPDGGSAWFETVKPLLYGGLFMVLIMTVGARYMPGFLKFVSARNVKELFLLAAISCALLAGILADAMQLSFSFGAFLAGIALSDSAFGKKVIGDMMPVRDLFAMIFFVSIGMMLDCEFLIRYFPVVLLVMLATSLSRTVFLAVVTWFSGYRNVIPVAMFFGMFATSEIAFVLIQLASSEKLISEGVHSLILCAVVCSMIAGPFVDGLTSGVYAFLRRTIWKNGTLNTITMPVPDLKDHVVIAGGEQIGRSVAVLFKRLGIPCLLIEPSYRAYYAAVKEELYCIFGEPAQEVILETAGLSRAKMLLAAAPVFSANHDVVSRAKKMYPDLPVITCADSQDELELLFECGVFDIIQPKFEAVLEMTRHALLRLQVSALEIQNYVDSVHHEHYKPVREDVRDEAMMRNLRRFTGLLTLNWVKLQEDSPVAEKTIAASQIRSRTGVSVVGVLHHGKAIITNPGPDHVLHAGDLLALIGTREQFEEFEKLLACRGCTSATPVAAELAAETQEDISQQTNTKES